MLDLTNVTGNYLSDEGALVRQLAASVNLTNSERAAITARATELVRQVRDGADPSIMEHFLAEYGLSTREGVALMCLAEALLRVPDADTIDDLIADKISSSDWDAHSGQSSSSLVNASTWALMLSGRMLTPGEDAGLLPILSGLLRRLGEPVIRVAVAAAMRELGDRFVLGQDIEDALANAADWRDRGHTFSFDMLGEGARTEADARRYHLAYADAITAIARHAQGDLRSNPGISVKLSALHPRYEATQRPRYFDSLLARLRSLALLAANGGIGMNIDAEEADRLEPSLELVDALLADSTLADWDGLGVVVQAYGRRAEPALEWLYETAAHHNRRIMVRLVKGAYWDTEIKRAQVLGLADYPVFTRKSHTDISYLACARRLLTMGDRIYPQFATHNAHTVAAVLQMARAHRVENFELQRLHGMGEALHDIVHRQHGTQCRIYAPVGIHKDLLAYLVRRLLENGANSSFVHQIVDQRVAAATVAADPLQALDAVDDWADLHNPRLRKPNALYADRLNSAGWDLSWQIHRDALEQARAAAPPAPTPAQTNIKALDSLIDTASRGASEWAATAVAARAAALVRAAEVLEENTGAIVALLTEEACKTRADAIAELREAVDFLRYYAGQAQQHAPPERQPCGVFACISPWNFPLAIFTGQIAAALVTGNAVVAKPAEQTPRIAALAVSLLHQAGIPSGALQLAVGDGTLGAALTRDQRIDGVCFTGSLATAQNINRAMAAHLDPAAPLIAETGGINAMIVDSTALPEQAVRDIITSAFTSAGQRCSALRLLYLQSDIAQDLLSMIRGAMDALVPGDPKHLDTDLGPVIDDEAYARIQDYLANAEVLHQTQVTADHPRLIPPTLVRVSGIEALTEEVFGPVLHIATFEAKQLGRVVERINRSGYGLTFGIHTRLDDRVQKLVEQLKVGNLYVNRNQIGAVVGSQPFGGEGLSGTGPKAGGPNYLSRFTRPVPPDPDLPASRRRVGLRRLNRLLRQLPVSQPAPVLREQSMPGPTGERNTLRLHPREPALVLGPTPLAALQQLRCAVQAGCATLVCCAADDALLQAVAELQGEGHRIAFVEGLPTSAALMGCNPLNTVAWSGDRATGSDLRRALAARPGAIVRFASAPWDPMAYLVERHVCIDTTAAGGNASLLSGTDLV